MLGLRPFSAHCDSPTRLDGCVALITGANSGIGKETAKEFYLRGAKVYMACRNLEKAECVLNEIAELCRRDRKDDDDDVVVVVGELLTIQLDLSDLGSVRECAKQMIAQEKKLDLLINNAGIMSCPLSYTKDEHEIQFGTNHLGHFLLTLLLMPLILKSPRARIVNVASMAYLFVCGINFDDINWRERAYSPWRAYAQSKLANILFTRELARRLKANGITHVTTYALHPGIIKTELARYMSDAYTQAIDVLRRMVWWTFKTPEQGAQTTLHCAISPTIAHHSGDFYSECKRFPTLPRAKNMETARKLWLCSLELVALESDYNPFLITALPC